MATRRPRVKVAANLSIRRPPKQNTTNAAVDSIKQEVPVTLQEPVKEHDVQNAATTISASIDVVTVEIAPKGTLLTPKPEVPREEPFQDFKLPKPVDDAAKQSCSDSTASLASTFHNGEEPMSPRKQDSRSIFTLPLARKRNRTESLTSNKSLPEGVTVNKVTRKLATKQEESQRTQENKKEIRKRLTNIENVNKQNLTMFDMIYYNPINNPMTPPALSKRGSLENIPKSVDGRERDGERSRSVSKSRSPTPAPSGSMPVTATEKPLAPVQLTPQLKLGPNGEMILDEASLVIENEREKEMRETLANTDIVYQDEYSGNSGYYSRIRRTKDWTDEETVRFYRCLHTIGTDFSMMLPLFPQRSRRDLKLKFKKEERINLTLVNKALLHPKEFNVDELRQQFAKEDELLEKQREEEKQRKMESIEQQQKEQLRKKLLLQKSISSNPQRRISKSERVLTDVSEPLGEEVKKPKRKSPSKKRSTTKPIIVTLPSIVEAEQEKEQAQQQEFGTVSEVNNAMILLCNSPDTITMDVVPKESLKQRKRAPVPKKTGTATLDTSTNIAELKVAQQVESVHDIVKCSFAGTVNTPESFPVDVAASKYSKRVPASKKLDTTMLVSTNVTSKMPPEQQQQQQHQSEFVPGHDILPNCTPANANKVPVNFALDNATGGCSTKSSSSGQPNRNTSPVPASSNVVEMPEQLPVETVSEENVLVIMDPPKNKSTLRTPMNRGAKKPWRRMKRKFKQKKQAYRKSTSVSAALKNTETKGQADCAVVIKKDITEEVPVDGNISNASVPNNPNEPFVSYEPAAVTYDNANLDLPIVKYQCMDDMEMDGYQISDDIMDTADYDADGAGDAAAVVASASTDNIVPDQEDDSITVITLQNLDDQTHTTCIRTDVGQSVQPTMINELTPVEIKYDEYESGCQQLVLSCAATTTKQELCSVENPKANANIETSTGRIGAINMQMINWPPATVPTTESISYMVYEKLEYGSSSGTVIIPDILPDKVTAFAGESAEYASAAQGASNVPKPEQQNSTDAVDDMRNRMSCYKTVTNSSPKHVTQSNASRRENQDLQKYTLFDTGISAKEIEEEPEEEEDAEEDDGGFSLEDIDINSLVLVESHDSVDPSKTFYEIYVSHPDTGQLSEKPLDVPADVIENIRQILEAGGTER
ncbi:transcription factor TFIIIB component B'' homolog [Anopheles marshallii]|uniref:transcription factor TFIIIB component B'' homolog n=1 Tax=Anopheles marshallii TaxID=1521116 RepID=UPI00237B7FD0|nr:transcription factor TFIIIB component B'' homolog [Anopheles marshallii]